MSSASRKRRNGQPQACEPCRKAKIRCDHGTPSCGRCARRDLACVYHPAPMTRTRDSITRSDRLPPSPTITPIDSYTISPDSSRLSLPPSRASLSDGTKSNSLFEKPPTSYGTTRFSAVFSENQASFGPAMLDVTEEEGHSKEASTDAQWSNRDENAATTARKELAINTLLDFPTFRTCEVMLQGLELFVDIWSSPTMTRHCLKQIWSEYGAHLGERRCRASVSQMANDLFENTAHTIRPDDNAHWHNWFGGSRLRWEMLGIIFTFAGFAFQHMQEWDPVFSLPEQQGRNRMTAADKMRECADSCLVLCQNVEVHDMMVVLMKNIWKLQSNILTDESDRIRTGSGMVASAFISAGLHRLPTYHDPTPLSHYRLSLTASLYYLDKCESLFSGRPPMASHHYCTYQLPLDLSEDEIYSGPEKFAAAKARLDPQGWNTSGKIHTLTYLRAICMQTSIREEILELSLGINAHFSKSQIDNLITRLDHIVSSYPPHIQYANISQYSSYHQAHEFYIVIRIHLDVLQCRFLLQRLAVSRSYNTAQDLFDIADQMMSVVLSLWLERDRLQNENYAFDWIVVCYGIPAAGVLCLELLNSSKPSNSEKENQRTRERENKIVFSRSKVVQSLTMFMAFLAWVRPTDGNAKLCGRLRRVCQRIVDRVLDSSSTTTIAPPASNPAVEVGEGHGMREESVGVGVGDNGNAGFTPLVFDEGILGLGLQPHDLDLDWLYTVDWTQGEWLDGTSNLSMNLNINLG